MFPISVSFFPVEIKKKTTTLEADFLVCSFIIN